MINKNKRGVATFTIIAGLLIALIIVYLILHLPIPAFTSIKNLINYFIVVILWFIVQTGIIYGYYRLGILVGKGYNIYKNKIHLWTVNVKNFIITKSI